MPDLGLEYAVLGTLIGLYMLSGLVIALPGGVLGRQFGEIRMCLLGLTLMTLGGLLMGLAETYALATIGRVIATIGRVI
ncbi:MAG: MFS transporter, partial [Alphaproteobacteria bacterium]